LWELLTPALTRMAMLSSAFPNKDFYAVVINFDDHEEILYQELMSPGSSYVYTSDISTSNGRLMALTEELEVAP